ncbi:MAG: hypothetical protein K0V04_45020 [Deltaproteobacteria bacterium]|nr:hypothetical protein [Deltaproteobacteria bacterium]
MTRPTSLLCAVVLTACQPALDSTATARPASEPASPPRAPAAELGSSVESGVEPASSPSAAEAEPAIAWRLTTVVTGGPQPLVGANGYYELVLEGERATLRKVGVRGNASASRR